MKVFYRFLATFSVGIFIASTTALLAADQLRYMDSSGNIHFVDSLSQVPYQYRLQVITPTPTPVYDKRTAAENLKRQREAEAAKQRKEKERQRLLRQRREELERLKRKEERELKQRDDSKQVQRLG